MRQESVSQCANTSTVCVVCLLLSFFSSSPSFKSFFIIFFPFFSSTLSNKQRGSELWSTDAAISGDERKTLTRRFSSWTSIRVSTRGRFNLTPCHVQAKFDLRWVWRYLLASVYCFCRWFEWIYESGDKGVWFTLCGGKWKKFEGWYIDYFFFHANLLGNMRINMKR